MAFDKDSLERTITSTLIMLCKNSLTFSTELRVQGLLGITVDDNVHLVQICEQFYAPEEGCEPVLRKTVLQPMKRPRPGFVPAPRRAVGPRMAPTAIRRNRGGSTTSRSSFPGPNRAFRGEQQHSSAGKGFPIVSRTGVPLTPKQESVSEVKQEAFVRPSSDIICVESDEEVEQAARGSYVVPKIERNMHDLVESAVNKARFIQQQSTATSEVLNNFGSDICSSPRDVKPNISSMSPSSSTMSLVPWTPTKPKFAHTSRDPFSIKSETSQTLISPGKVMMSPMRSPSASASRSPWKQASPAPAAAETTAAWTSVTQTTFVCTVNGCDRRFTTKRAMVRHQKDKHLTADGDGSLSSQEYSTGSIQYEDADDMYEL